MMFAVFLAASAFFIGYVLGAATRLKPQKKPQKHKENKSSAQSEMSNFLNYDGSQQE